MSEEKLESTNEYTALLKRRTRWMWATVITGFGILIPPIVGLLGTVVSMIQAFDTMGMSGGQDPTVLSRNISLALMTTAGGLVVSLFFLILFVISLIRWLVACSAVTNFGR